MAAFPNFNWGLANYTSLSDTVGVTFDMTVVGAPFAVSKVFQWQCPAYAYTSGTVLMGIPKSPPSWPGWPPGWQPAGVLPAGNFYFSFTLPAGQTSYQHDFGGVKSIFVTAASITDAGVAGATTPLSLIAIRDTTDPLILTATAILDGDGVATVNGAETSTFFENDTLHWEAVGTGFIKWTIDGVDYLTAEVYTIAGAVDVAGTAYFTPSEVLLSGSVTSLTTPCKLSPYANLGAGNVLIQPHATILAGGTFISNGGTKTVEIGDVVQLSVSTEAIYTRLVSVLVNGVEKVSGNQVNWNGSITIAGDTTVVAVVAADRFCYQAKPKGGGGDEDPDPPIVPRVLNPDDPTDTLDPWSPTKDPWPPKDPETPIPPVPPKPPKPPKQPPVPPVPTPTPVGATGIIDFMLVDNTSLVELTKIGGVYQALNTQRIKYVPVSGDAPYQWVFGDNSPDSTDTSPDHRYYFSGDNLFAVTYYAVYPGTSVTGNLTKLVHVIEDISVPPVIDPETPWIPRPTGSWPDLFPTGVEGLILRWRDELGNWSKERRVSLDRRDPHALLSRLGEYRVRQWEIVMVDSLPQVVCYIEEEVTLDGS